MYLLGLKSILTSVLFSFSLNAFSYDMICKDDKGKQIFSFNLEKPLSSQISNKLGMKVVIIKGFNGDGNRFSFVANSAQEFNLKEYHSFILNGFGQIIKRDSLSSKKLISLKEISLKMNKVDNLLNLGTVEILTSSLVENENQKIEYANCSFDMINQNEIKIFSKILEALKQKR